MKVEKRVIATIHVELSLWEAQVLESALDKYGGHMIGGPASEAQKLLINALREAIKQ